MLRSLQNSSRGGATEKISDLIRKGEGNKETARGFKGTRREGMEVFITIP